MSMKRKKKINLEGQMFFINLKSFLYAYLAKDMWTKKMLPAISANNELCPPLSISHGSHPLQCALRGNSRGRKERYALDS